jgi:hypothetical protein
MVGGPYSSIRSDHNSWWLWLHWQVAIICCCQPYVMAESSVRPLPDGTMNLHDDRYGVAGLLPPTALNRPVTRSLCSFQANEDPKTLDSRVWAPLINDAVCWHIARPPRPPRCREP